MAVLWPVHLEVGSVWLEELCWYDLGKNTVCMLFYILMQLQA